MSIVLIAPEKAKEDWENAFKKHDANVELEFYPEIEDKEKVDFALTWNHPEGSLQQFSNLKVVASMGVGVNHILKDPDLPKNVTITKMEDKQLAKDMSVFVLALVMSHLRKLTTYKYLEERKEWDYLDYLRVEDVKIGIMGIGALGQAVGKTLVNNGFRVNGWSRSKKNLENIKSFAGTEELEGFLSEADILVLLLPLTSETEDILDKRKLQQLPKGAYIINVARGHLIVDEDLMEMIDNGHISGAALDVFRKEPLPKDHPFWEHKKINVTPHTASNSDPNELVPQVLENYKNMKKDKPLKNVVDRKKEY